MCVICGAVDKSGAMAMYRRGIAELQLGVAVDVDGRGEQYDRARRLRDKMAANLAMATDRLTVLGEYILLLSFISVFIWVISNRDSNYDNP
jgi:hypothetical protein